MKKSLTILFCLFSFVVVLSHSTGEEGRTGSPGETTCRNAGCHNSFTLNSGPGSITITHNIPVAGYIPSQSYTINVTVAQANRTLFGFGFEALSSSNVSAGSFVITDPGSTQLATATNGRLNVIHTNNGGLTPAGVFTKTFTFTWVAPSTNVGTVTFYAAGNAANNNNNATGDYIYNTSLVIPSNSVSILTGAITGGPFCEGQTGISIPYSVLGTFNPGNIFTAQLSDNIGSFSSPLNLGTITSTTNGVIVTSVGLPSIAGTAYRIRVISSNPSAIGSDNGSNLTINLNPTTANAGPDQTVCTNSVILSGNIPSVGVGAWTLISGSGTITNPSLNNTSVSGLSAGNNVFQWTTSNSCGTSTDQVTINFSGTITVADAGLDQSICSTTSSVTMSGNTPTTGTGSWSLTNGSGTITSFNLPNTTITNLGIGQNTFRWTISNPPCTPTFDEVVINVSEVPTNANAGPDFTSCVDSADLVANTPIIGFGEWSVVSGSGTFSNVNDPNATIYGLSPGLNTLSWTINNSPCATSSDNIIINQSGSITASNAGSDQQVCGTNAILMANTPSFGSGLWSVVSGTGVFTNATDPLTTISGLSYGNNTFRWTITNGACQPSSDDVNIISVQDPTTSNAGTNVSICDTATILNANSPSIGTGLWTVINGSGLFQNANFPTTQVSNLSIGTNTYRWTISNLPCPSSFSDVVIDNCNGSFINTDSIIGSPFCSVTSYSVEVPFTSFGTYNGFYSAELSDSSGNFNANSPIIIGASNTSPIYATIPSNTIGGSGYRIRVNNSDPVTIGNDNGYNLSINNCPNLFMNFISGSPFCSNTSYDITVDFSITGTYDGPFIVELSDAIGDFSNPQTIGYGYFSPVAVSLPTGLNPGTNYRIRIRDYNSGETSSVNPNSLSINTCVVGILNSQLQSGIKIYPNPNNGVFIISSEESMLDFYEIFINDITGKIVYSQQCERISSNSQISLSLSQLENGVYFVHLNAEGRIINLPLVINK